MKTIKALTLTSIALALCGAGQIASAHTGIQNKIDVPATGSGTVYNNIVIGHTCEQANGSHIPVIAQSVVLPTVNPTITEGSGTGTASTKTIGDLLQKSATDTAAVTTLANLAQLIQSKDIFSAQREKFDSSGDNVIGFEGTKGKLDSSLHGLVPFRVGGLFFKPTACIKTLNVKIAIADICKLTFKTGGPAKGAANIWMQTKTNKFTTDVDGIGSPATLTFTNTATTVDPTCTNGNNIDYSIWPSNDDIDANLPIKKYWGR
ncbi:MAG: hypothetical protein ABL925_08895 [Methylococcales bacterium]